MLNIELLVTEFNSKIEMLSNDESLEPWEKVSAAIGYAVFKTPDKNVSDVFHRADQNMYERKKQMKAERKE